MYLIFPKIQFLLFLVSILILQLLFGFILLRLRNYFQAITLSWIFLGIATMGIEELTSGMPPVLRMLFIIFAMLIGMKVIVAVEYYKDKTNRLSLIQWLAFSVGWFGMRPALFETLGKKVLPGSTKLIIFGVSRMVIGIILLALANIVLTNFSGISSVIIAAALSLSGLSFILHFGILNVSAGFWRLSGVDSRMLFKAPLLSVSLTEFWGKRWNLAFSEMTSIALYRPLKKWSGETVAVITAFLFSGFLHELAISLPVNNGWGLPMLYFMIHGLLMLLERFLKDRGIDIGKNKWIGRIWVIFWLIAPLPLLFHKAFLKGIILPLIVGN